MALRNFEKDYVISAASGTTKSYYTFWSHGVLHNRNKIYELIDKLKSANVLT
jgi:hypothetical protein